MGKLLVIKLGGSVITYKDSQVPKARTEVIGSLSKEIRQLLEQNRCRLILVHGAGSYAHPLVKKYKLNQGMKTTLQKLMFAKTCQSMLKLNSIILETLIKNQVSAITLSPHTFVTQKAGKFKGFDYQIIKDLMNLPRAYARGIFLLLRFAEYSLRS